LKNRLAELAADYDYCILDTPPALNLLLQNALIAADGVIVPILSDSFSVDGLNDFYQTVVDIKSQPNPGLEILGLLLVRFDKRSVLNKEAAHALPSVASKLDTIAFDTKIRHTVVVPESQVARMPLFEYDKRCTAAKDYDAFIDELERRGLI
jgi:chromosome partitioning protein